MNRALACMCKADEQAVGALGLVLASGHFLLIFLWVVGLYQRWYLYVDLLSQAPVTTAGASRCCTAATSHSFLARAGYILEQQAYSPQMQRRRIYCGMLIVSSLGMLYGAIPARCGLGRRSCVGRTSVPESTTAGTPSRAGGLRLA